MPNETADQRMQRMAKEYGIPYTPAGAAPTPAPTPTPKPAVAPKAGVADRLRSMFGDRAKKLEEQERQAMGMPAPK